MGSKSPAQTTQVNKTELSPEQQQLFDLAMPYATQYGTQPLTSYTGQTIAGFNPTEQAAQAGYVGTAAPIGQDLATKAAIAQTFMLDPAQLSPTSNPYAGEIADQITSKIGNQLTQNVLPNLRAGATSAGGMYSGGSTRGQMAEYLAGTGATAEMGKALNEFYFNNYQAGLNNINKAIGQNPSVQMQQLFGSDVLSTVGAQGRAMEQAQLDESLKQWTIQQQLPYMRASEVLGLIQGMPGSQGVSTVTGAQPSTNPWMGAAGGAASGAALGSMVMPGVGTAVGAILGGLGGYATSR